MGKVELISPEGWFQEDHKGKTGFRIKVKEVLWSGSSEFQRLDVIDSEAFGRVLLLDGLFMTTEKDEFIYHEMIVHPAMFTHPEPRNVLVIGGGDGGTVREVVRHPSVEHVDLVEIDKLVVDKAREFFPTIACELDNPKVSIHYEDGIEWVKNSRDSYDVILIDSTDPIGPAVGLFSREFYGNCKSALRPGGVLAAQAESAHFDHEEIASMAANLGRVFPEPAFYNAAIPTYPGGLWCFAIASMARQPQTPPVEKRFSTLSASTPGGLKYYNPALHAAAFALPNFLLKVLGKL